MRKIIVILLALAASFSFANAQEPQQVMGTAEEAASRTGEKSLEIQGPMGKLYAVMREPDIKTKGKVPVVVLMHGFTGQSNKPMFWQIADRLAAKGIASIRFDFNGHGKSEGDFQNMTVPNEIEDAKAVISYVKSLPTTGKVALLGHSQGGVVASMVAGELGKKNISAVVLMAPAAVLREDAIRGNTRGKTYDPLNPPEYVDLGNNLKLGRDYITTAFSLPIYETAAKYHGPALMIHGTGDRVVPYTYSELYHSIWKKSEICILPGFDHGFTQDLKKATDIAADWLISKL
jgi:pimeloyl-ACP methyl ester carboxylesterase